MASRKTYEDWLAEKLRQDPHFERDVEDFWASYHGPRRKIRVLADENLEQEFINELRGQERVNVATAPKGTSDDLIWRRARSEHRVIVTGDEDFWDDQKYPLRQTHGVLILRGSCADDRLLAMVHAWVVLDLPALYSRYPDPLAESKARFSRDSGYLKFFDNDSTVEAELPF